MRMLDSLDSVENVETQIICVWLSQNIQIMFSSDWPVVNDDVCISRMAEKSAKRSLIDSYSTHFSLDSMLGK